LVSFPPLIDMLKFSGYSYLIRGQPVIHVTGAKGLLASHRRHSVARSKLLRVEPTPGPPLSLRAAAPRRAPTPQPHKGSWRGCYDARTGMPLGIPRGAMCVQRFDDSLNSAIHITYRISLRSSSMPEPRDPLLKVLSIQ
jgi:hypothetical protein